MNRGGRHRASRRGADERGLAAPAVVTLAGLLLVLTLVGGGLGRLLVDQRRVSMAADLAALAGAGALQAGRDPCSAAHATAGRNSAELIACRVTGDRVAVTAAIPSPGGGLLALVGRSVSIEARAVAGPVGSSVS